MKRLIATAGLAILVLAGCSSNTTATKDSADGESLYMGKCAACHGENLKGRVGPSLLNLSSKYSEDQVLKIINDGTKNMPGHLLTEEESNVVTKWLMKK